MDRTFYHNNLNIRLDILFTARLGVTETGEKEKRKK
jgi:hypothetical protein